MRAANLYPFVLEAIRSVASTQVENEHMGSKVNCSLKEAAVWGGRYLCGYS